MQRSQIFCSRTMHDTIQKWIVRWRSSLAKKAGISNWNASPPRSSEFNVLDMGFFIAIKSLQDKEAPTYSDELIECVGNTHNKFSQEKLDNEFLSFQQTMNLSMLVQIRKENKLQHTRKDELRREGKLPIRILCSEIAVQNVRVAHLHQWKSILTVFEQVCQSL